MILFLRGYLKEFSGLLKPLFRAGKACQNNTNLILKSQKYHTCNLKQKSKKNLLAYTRTVSEVSVFFMVQQKKPWLKEMFQLKRRPYNQKHGRN